MSGPTSLLARAAAIPKAIVGLLLLAILGLFVWTIWPSPKTEELTAYFTKTVALYPGSDVRILGVPVGKVDTVVPEGERVKVTLHYDSKYPLPADAKAVIVSPDIVGDRFVQLTPAYVSGPRLPDNAVLGLNRTATPVELDTIYRSINNLSVALGPRGANKHGALQNLLHVSAENLAGNGAKIHQTLHDIGSLTGTLNDNKSQFFSTVTQLNRFVGMLARNDTTVRAFNRDLASVSRVLAGDRTDMAAALHNLSTALGAVSQSVNDNKDTLRHNIGGLRRLTQILVTQRNALVQALDVAPQALDNLYHTYNPTSGTLDTRANISQNVNQLTSDPAVVLCAILHQAGNSGAGCSAVKKVFNALPPLGLNRPTPLHGEQIGPVVVEHIDKTLGGLVKEGN
ncbi:MAG: MCE family protein [Nocardioidaceae bacterium]